MYRWPPHKSLVLVPLASLEMHVTLPRSGSCTRDVAVEVLDLAVEVCRVVRLSGVSHAHADAHES